MAREYAVLTQAVTGALAGHPGIVGLCAALKEVNAELWRIEDDIRAKERAQEFDADFIALARAVYRTNDRSAELKREINLLAGSDLIEEKGHLMRRASCVAAQARTALDPLMRIASWVTMTSSSSRRA